MKGGELMGLLSTFWNSIFKRDISNWIPDFEIYGEDAKRLYLKELAKSTVINFVARTMSSMTIKLPEKGYTEWDYVLNVRPNKNQTAASFWEKFFYRLIDENEVLVIMGDNNDLLIADDFEMEELAVYESRFKNVQVNGYTFERTFYRSDVIYMKYNNDKLDKFMDGLFKDYGELFGRILEVAMRNNQIRGSVSIETTGTLNDEKDKNGKTLTSRLQEYIDKIYESFKTNSVAIVPKLKGFDYEEYTNKMGVSNQSIEELNKMKSSLIDDVANAIGVPTALIYGEKSDLDSNLKAFRKLCTNNLVKKTKDELTNAIISKGNYIKGDRLKIWGVLPYDIIEYAVNIDKIGSGGLFEIDEVRESVEFNPLPNNEGKQRIQTKNYDKAKGGEDKDDENENSV